MNLKVLDKEIVQATYENSNVNVLTVNFSLYDKLS